MAEYYIWNTEAEAQAALDFVNGTSWFPLVGNNSATGKPEPNKQQTLKWADSVQQRNTDGKWGFPRVPSAIMDAIGVSAEERQSFLDAFTPSIEDLDPIVFVDLDSSSSSSGE